jgi:hypothetical protein
MAARPWPVSPCIDAAAGSVEDLTRILAQIRARWPQVEIVIRGDSGFCREDIMAWCEANGVHFLLGLAKSDRLIKRIGETLYGAQCAYRSSGQASRVFEDIPYRTVESWSQAHRVAALRGALGQRR